MSRNDKKELTEKKHLKWDTASIIVLVGAALVTLVLIGLLIFNVARPFKYAHYDDMNEVVYEDYKKQDAEEYYVFVLDGNSPKAQMVESLVVQYANYARTHAGAKDIYIYNFHAEGNTGIASDLAISGNTEKNLPGLITIKKGSVGKKYLNVSDLSNELAKAMGK